MTSSPFPRCRPTGERGSSALRRGAASDRRLLARRELPLGGADLPARQPPPARAAAPRARQAPPARPLGHDARAQPHLRAHEPRHPRLGPRRDLRHRTGPRRPRHRRQRLLGGHVQRGLPEHRTGRRGDAHTLPPVLIPGRDPEPRGPRDARLDPRGRRARLRHLPRLRRRVRQPRPLRVRRGGGRRGRDGAALGLLAEQQVPEPRHRRRRPAHPASQRLQDRQPHGARPHPPRGAAGALRGPRLPPLLRRGRRPASGPPAPGGRSRRVRAGDPRHPARGPRAGRDRSTHAGR